MSTLVKLYKMIPGDSAELILNVMGPRGYS